MIAFLAHHNNTVEYGVYIYIRYIYIQYSLRTIYFILYALIILIINSKTYFKDYNFTTVE